MVQAKTLKWLKALRRNTFRYSLNLGETWLSRFKSGCRLQKQTRICVSFLFSLTRKNKNAMVKYKKQDV